MLWLQNKTHPTLSLTLRISARTARFPAMSRPLAGSSNNRFFGLWIIALASATFSDCPFENPRARRSANSSISRVSISSSVREESSLPVGP